MADAPEVPHEPSRVLPDPSLIMALTTGYWASAALLAANELGIFGVVTEDGVTADHAATALGLDARAAGALLTALVDIGLLELDGDLLKRTPAATTWLNPASPHRLAGAISWAGDQYAAWGDLANSVRSGLPSRDATEHLGGDSALTRRFVLGMHQRAVGVAAGVVQYMDVAGAASMLDVGGGPGTYSAMLLQANSGLRATVLDLPAVVDVAEELIAELGLGGRITFNRGDAACGEYGSELYDIVLMAGVLHQMGPSTIVTMLSGAKTALKPGGKLIVCDIMRRNIDGNQSPFPALFGLQMLLTSRAGGTFTVAQCETWFRDAGFVSVSHTPTLPPLPYVLVTGKRSGSA